MDMVEVALVLGMALAVISMVLAALKRTEVSPRIIRNNAALLSFCMAILTAMYMPEGNIKYGVGGIFVLSGALFIIDDLRARLRQKKHV